MQHPDNPDKFVVYGCAVIMQIYMCYYWPQGLLHYPSALARQNPGHTWSTKMSTTSISFYETIKSYHSIYLNQHKWDGM